MNAHRLTEGDIDAAILANREIVDAINSGEQSVAHIDARIAELDAEIVRSLGHTVSEWLCAIGIVVVIGLICFGL